MREMKRRKLAKVELSLLNEDTMTKIFLCLPVKSLIRFKRLSKRWYFLISHKDSYFRRIYLSDRIVGSNDDDYFHPIMPGFFYQMPEKRGGFLPCTSTYKGQEMQQYSRNTKGKKGKKGKKCSINNPFSSLDKSLDKFLSCCLCRDRDSDGVPKKIFIAASSNGFLLCSLESFSPETFYLLNPVTMEWATLPIPKNIKQTVYVGFVCKGNYPSIHSVEYKIVRIALLEGAKLLVQFFSSGDIRWREYSCSCESLVKFSMTRKQNPVIVTSANNNNNQAGGPHPGIVVYFLVDVGPGQASAIAVFDLNKGDDDSLQIIKTPGQGMDLEEQHRLLCADYIREFDDGGVIHYVRISADFEFWVLNTETKEWCLKHRANLVMVMKRYRWMDFSLCRSCIMDDPLAHYRIHAFHPMNPNLIFLTMFGRMVCYNVQTKTLELIYDDDNSQNMLDDYSHYVYQQNMLDDFPHYVYQWPCWPPLL